MAAKSRTFHVGPSGSTRPIVLHNTAKRTWRMEDGALFIHYGHSWLGEPGQRYRFIMESSALAVAEELDV